MQNGNKNTILNLNIGEQLLAIEFNDPDVFEYNKKKFRNFINTAANALKNQIIVEIGSNLNGFINRPEYNVTELAKLNFDATNSLITFFWRDFCGEFNSLTKRARINSYHDTGVESFLRLLYSFLLLENAGFLIHAASFVKDGKGYLFPGKSGAGKTTIAKNSPGVILLSDEISLIKQSGGKFHLYGTPFHGEIARAGENISAPLHAIYFPKKDAVVFRKKLNKMQVLERLLPNVISWATSHDLNNKLLDICIDFVKNKFSGYELHFLPESSFWRVID